MKRKRYQALIVDPPWAYRNVKTGGSHCSGSAQKYPVLSIREIKDLPILNIVHPKRCALFLWVPNPLKPEAMDVVNAWGFRYKHTLYWRKIMSRGLGFWYRGQVEELWLCIRGKVKAFRCQRCNVHQSKALAHSHKDPFFYDLIEDGINYGSIEDRAERRKYRLTPRIELFATGRRRGWDATGFEVDGVDIRDFLGDK